MAAELVLAFRLPARVVDDLLGGVLEPNLPGCGQH
jgi:hypothetical protein